MNKKELRAKLIAEMRELSDKAKAETRSFTADEQKLYDEKNAEVQKLSAEIEAEEREAVLAGFSAAMPAKTNEGEKEAGQEDRSAAFVQTGKTEMRAVLATGQIAKPSKAGTEVNGLAAVADSIVDDVHAIPLTGTGAWVAPYKKTDAKAGATTDGSKVGGTGSGASTGSTYDYVTINPAEWGVLDEISKQVKKMSPTNYEKAVKDSALIALRAYAADKIIAAVKASSLKESKAYPLDAKFVRACVLGYRSIAGKGPVKLYLSQAALIALGDVRGTNEKKPVFEISFADESNTSGTIKDGGTSVSFRILDGLNDNEQFFGQPGAIDMPMWDNYQIETDEHGDYFQRNVMGIRGIQTANADLAAKNGMQVITQASS